MFTPGIWWYARFPNHYSGEGAAATKELGEFDQKEWSRQIAEALKAIKADQVSLKLQNQFFEDRSTRWTQSSNSMRRVAYYSGLGEPMALSCLASLTRALSSFFCTLATSPGSTSAGADFAYSASESSHCAAASRMRPVFS